jgi:hypothetical protein
MPLLLVLVVLPLQPTLKAVLVAYQHLMLFHRQVVVEAVTTQP